MPDPYWDAVHMALSAATLARSPRKKDRNSNDFDPGDIAMCMEGTRLRYIFYDYVQSKLGQALGPRVQRVYREIILHAPPLPRPCVVLERHGHDSYIVCFLTNVGYSDDERIDPMLQRLSIPCGNYTDQGLRVWPPFNSRLLFAVPVVRSKLEYHRVVGRGLRWRLDFGELERARMLVREKVAELKANHAEIRAQHLAFQTSEAYGQRPPPARTVTPPPPVVSKSLMHQTRYRTRQYFSPLEKHTYLTPHHTSNDVSWILRHWRHDIAEASRYLSSVVHPRPPPIRRLPRPFYSPLLRASPAFVGRVLA
ncbi:hypothetical protein B0H10DRAFT_2217357 [Mycena sp. CBHHK59/15]|nr:hypothetical protein B0H10DRAFT_2217357 [Mycena sp. CBHHK59/15]